MLIFLRVSFCGLWFCGFCSFVILWFCGFVVHAFVKLKFGFGPPLSCDKKGAGCSFRIDISFFLREESENRD